MNKRIDSEINKILNLLSELLDGFFNKKKPLNLKKIIIFLNEGEFKFPLQKEKCLKLKMFILALNLKLFDSFLASN